MKTNFQRMLTNIVLLMACSVLFNNKYLSEEWAEKSKAKTSKENKDKRNRLLKEGDGYNSKKKYENAIKSYEEALEILPSSELYYAYGNSLSNLTRNKEAILAFKRSSDLHHFKAKHVFYNLTCLYSLEKKIPEAYKSLELAILNGYNNFQHLNKDADLTNLRTDEGWQTFLVQAKKKSFLLKDNKLDKVKLSGKEVYNYGMHGMIDSFSLCPNNKLFYAQYPSEELASKTELIVIKYGTWDVTKNSILFKFTREKGHEGIGKQTWCSDDYCYYSTYKPYDKAISTKQEVKFLEELEITATSQDPGTWHIRELIPKHCD